MTNFDRNKTNKLENTRIYINKYQGVKLIPYY